MKLERPAPKQLHGKVIRKIACQLPINVLNPLLLIVKKLITTNFDYNQQIPITCQNKAQEMLEFPHKKKKRV